MRVPTRVELRTIYDTLRLRKDTITYGQLVGSIPSTLGLHARDGRLDGILNYLATYCDKKGLPPISALVVNQETQRPGTGFFIAMRRPVSTPEEEAAALVGWAIDIERIRKTDFPDFDVLVSA